MGLYNPLVRSLLFRLRPDTTHALAHAALRWPLPWQLLGRAAPRSHPRLETDLAGLPLLTPVGLAPGFDKNGELVPGLSALGFGYLVVGSITRDPRAGNPFPRLVRYPKQLSIANSMGLPSRGVEAAVASLTRLGRRRCPVIASVAGFSVDELVQTATAVEPHVEAVELGLVCPNSTETERLEEARLFAQLLETLAKARTKPLFVKLPPHHTAEAREQTCTLVEICLRLGIEGLSVSGTRPIPEPRLGTGRGSLAGKAVFEDSLRIVADVATFAAGRLAIKASGGVFSGEDAYRMLRAGATTVEVYSAFIYRGWSVAGQISRELSAILTREGIPSVRQLHSSAASGTVTAVGSRSPAR
jgi:dihydroorotate dehydrogenase (fumarate)/dihydroorotate dehydrogenase